MVQLMVHIYTKFGYGSTHGLQGVLSINFLNSMDRVFLHLILIWDLIFNLDIRKVFGLFIVSKKSLPPTFWRSFFSEIYIFFFIGFYSLKVWKNEKKCLLISYFYFFSSQIIKNVFFFWGLINRHDNFFKMQSYLQYNNSSLNLDVFTEIYILTDYIVVLTAKKPFLIFISFIFIINIINTFSINLICYIQMIIKVSLVFFCRTEPFQNWKPHLTPSIFRPPPPLKIIFFLQKFSLVFIILNIKYVSLFQKLNLRT